MTLQPIRIHSYESMGTYDGPGLRMVVFLQGCQFRCLYCANPDTMEGVGHPTSAEEILDRVLGEQAFFGKKGGVTFSGGEPTLQAAALLPLFARLREHGVHICLDTNGGVWNEDVEALLRMTDLVLLDVKHIHPESHRALTGQDNEQTLRTAAWLEEHQRPFWLRYVLVPDLTDAEEHIRALGERLGGYRQIRRVEILPYHRLGVHKYEALGKPYLLSDTKENSPQQLERAEQLFKQYFEVVVVN